MGKQHLFTPIILKILKDRYGKPAESIYTKSDLLQYLNIKTQSAASGSKARAAFGKHFSIHAIVEDYIDKGFMESGRYRNYEGARFSDLFHSQRSLPFGTKLQNHDLNNRINDDFRSNFPESDFVPILHDPVSHRYWINENLLKVKVGGKTYNIAPAILDIIQSYIAAKKSAFEQFLADCQQMAALSGKKTAEVRDFIAGRLQQNVDARVFEIVSYAILKQYYETQSIFWGWTLESIQEEGLVLYKTGRTNANDGGIDFVMRPLGRFFQVTETVDVRKYFLDIDKIQRFPLTFVIKSNDPVDVILSRIKAQANRVYSIDKIVERYMGCIEGIINIPLLLERFDEICECNRLKSVISEIVLQSKVEFNVT
ncbi:MAG: restriction endonuclease [Pirellulaceae bacterium]|nr:restriction endonuclease [Pirellulaceae bacterium]